MEADGAIDLNELETVFAKSGLKLSNRIIKNFHKLDTNKNGKIEKSEVNSEGSGEGEDYFNPFTLLFAVAGFAVAGFLVEHVG